MPSEIKAKKRVRLLSLFPFGPGELSLFPRGVVISHRITSHHITSHHITSDQIRSDHITSHHITSHHITSQHGPGAKRQKMSRNGSGIYENQHNLVKTARNFDASPAATTGMPQDPFLVSKRVETARSAAWGASPLNFMLFWVILQGCNGV